MALASDFTFEVGYGGTPRRPMGVAREQNPLRPSGEGCQDITLIDRCPSTVFKEKIVRARIVYMNAVLVALAIAAGVAASDEPSLEGRLAESEAPKTVSTPVGIHIGTTDSAGWTTTTYEAATAEANKKVLASGKAATVTGEVVDISCYLQLGKRGEAHVPCGSKCIEHGQPIGLLDNDERLYILFAEEHHPRRDGQVDLKKVFAPLLAKTVTVTGMMTEMKDYRALFVRVANLGGVKPAEGGTKK